MKQIPNIITCLNVISGTLAIFMSINGEQQAAVFLILVAMIFDFFDGFMARLLKAYSDLGKELDSLADVISFGVAPAFIAYNLILKTLPGGSIEYWESWNLGMKTMIFSPMLIPAFSAYRLAKFNLDSRQTTSFIGMPTPAHAMFWASLIIGQEYGFVIYDYCFATPYTLGVSVIILSILLVSELPMFSLKIKGFAWKQNRVLYLFLITILVLGLLLGKEIIMLIIPIYILFSIIESVRQISFKK